MIDLSTPTLRAQIMPELGAGIYRLDTLGPKGKWVGVMRETTGTPTRGGDLASFFMCPWVNRMKHGKFTFQGKEYNLGAPRTDKDSGIECNIHGVVMERPFEVFDRTPTSATLKFDSVAVAGRGDEVNWPWAFVFTVKYEIMPDALRVETSLKNTSDSDMPAGYGLHPYHPRTLWNKDDNVTVQAGVAGQFPTSWLYPTGPAQESEWSKRLNAGEPIEDFGVDSTFDGWNRTATYTWDKSGVEMVVRASEIFSKYHFFTRPPKNEDGNVAPGQTQDEAYRDAFDEFAAEPQTSTANAISFGEAGSDWAGNHVLKPGESLDGWVTFSVGMV